MLRILFVTSTPFVPELGAARVMVDLADEFRALGHSVDRFSRENTPQLAVWSRTPVRRLLDGLALSPSFPRLAHRFLRNNQGSFDVIDANQGGVALPPERLGHDGILVCRSTGLYAQYSAFDAWAKRRWPQPVAYPARIAQSLRWPAAQRHRRATEAALRYADVINVPSRHEQEYLEREPSLARKCVTLPIGLPVAGRRGFKDRRLPAADRLRDRTVAYVGTWSARKGMHDWPAIVREVRRRLPDAKFRLLGTHHPADLVRAAFSENDRAAVTVVETFRSEHLPALLEGAGVGAFPSYLEAFGIGVLEMLASGLPVVAYDAPGPRETLAGSGCGQLVPAGDTKGFAEALVQLFRLSPEAYASVGAASDAVADRLQWPAIARATLDHYTSALGERHPWRTGQRTRSRLGPSP